MSQHHGDDDAVYIDPSSVVEEIVLDGTDAPPADFMDDDEDDGADAGATGEQDDEEDAEEEEREPALRQQQGGVPEGMVEFEDDSVQGFFAHTDSVYCVALAATEPATLAVTGGGDDVAYLWRVEDGKDPVGKLDGHKDSVNAVAFSADASLVATGGLDGMVRVWKCADASLVQSLEGPDEVEWLCWHPRGNVLLAGSHDGSVWMWNAPTGLCMQVLTGHSGAVTAGGFTADGKRIVSVGEDATLRVWDPKQGTAQVTWHGPEGIPALSLALHLSLEVAVVGLGDGTAAVVHLGTGKKLALLQGHRASVESVSLSPIASMAATASTDGTLCVWDLNTFTLRHRLEHPGGVVAVQWHVSEPLIFAQCTDALLRLWDARTGKVVRAWRGHQDAPLAMAVSKDCNTLVSVGDDRVALVFANSDEHSWHPGAREAEPQQAAA